MGLEEFWLHFNNGTKSHLNKGKHGVRREQMDGGNLSVFDLFDENKNGTLEAGEIKNIENTLRGAAGDSVFDDAENRAVNLRINEDCNIWNADFQAFVYNVSSASTEIESTTEKKLKDGGKEVITKYRDGSVETIGYYPDGSWKYTKYDKHVTDSDVRYKIEDVDGDFDEDGINAVINDGYQRYCQDHKQQVAEYNNKVQAQEKMLKENYQRYSAQYEKDKARIQNQPRGKDSGPTYLLMPKMTYDQFKQAAYDNGGVQRIATPAPLMKPNEYKEWALNQSGVIFKFVNNTRIDEHKEVESPKYQAEKLLKLLGIDLNTDEGKLILERMSMLPQFVWERIGDGAELKEILDTNGLTPSFNNISNILEILYQATLRNEEELKSFEAVEGRAAIENCIFAMTIMSILYEQVAEWNGQYTDNAGLFTQMAEGLQYLINKVGLDGQNHYQWAESCREFSQKIQNFKVFNPEKFNEEFKALTGKNFNGLPYREMYDKFQKGEYIDADGNYTEEFADKIKSLSGFDLYNPNDDTYQAILSGIGETLLMVMTLGVASEAKGGQMLAQEAIGTFAAAGTRIAAKQVSKKAIQGVLKFLGGTVKLIGPMINEGTKMAVYTLVSGTLSNSATTLAKGQGLDEFAQREVNVLEGAKSSMMFGAFAGAYGTAVTSRVTGFVSKIFTKSNAAKVLSGKFANGAVKAEEVFTTFMKESVPKGMAKLGTETAAFLTDVVGFTGFEVLGKLLTEYDDFKNKSISEITEILWEEFKGQGYNLAQIKIVSWFLGSHSARMMAGKPDMNLSGLNGVTVEKVKISKGKKSSYVYDVVLKDGQRVRCKNQSEMITALSFVAKSGLQTEQQSSQVPEPAKKPAVPKAKPEPKPEPEPELESELKPEPKPEPEPEPESEPKPEPKLESNANSLSERIASASSRDELNAVMQEVKKLPRGQERTALENQYLARQQQLRDQSPYVIADVNGPAEFKTMARENAVRIIDKVVPESNFGNRQTQIEEVVEACTIDGRVSEELLSKAVFMLQNGLEYYNVKNNLKVFKTEKGVNRETLDIFDKMAGASKDDIDNTIRMLNNCVYENGDLNHEVYDRRMELKNPKDFGASCVVEICLVDGKIDENLWQKAKELEAAGFNYYSISTLIEICRGSQDVNNFKPVSQKKIGTFSQEIYDKIFELKNKYNVSKDEIPNILSECLKDGKFDSNKYDFACKLKIEFKDDGLVRNALFVADSAPHDVIIKCFKEILKYESDPFRAKEIYRACCDGEITKEVFSKQRYDIVMKLLAENGETSARDVTNFMYVMSVDGKFEQQLYDKFMEYRKLGLSDNDLVDLFDACKTEGGMSGRKVNYKLVDKIKTLFDVQIKNLELLFITKEMLGPSEYHGIAQNIRETLTWFKYRDADYLIDYAEKFESKYLNFRSFAAKCEYKDANGNIKYSAEVLDKCLELFPKYEDLHSEHLLAMLSGIKINKHGKTPEFDKNLHLYESLFAEGIKFDRSEFYKYLKDADGNLIPEMVELCKYAKGLKPDDIIVLIRIHSKNPDAANSTELGLDKEAFKMAVDVVKVFGTGNESNMGEFTNIASNLSEWSDIIQECVQAGVTIETFQQFLQRTICTIGVMTEPKIKNQVRRILTEVKNHPDKLNEIKEIFNSYRNSENCSDIYDICFNHIEDGSWKKLIYLAISSKAEQSNRIIKVIKELDIPGADLVRLSEYIHAMKRNLAVADPAPEVVARIKESMKTGDLDRILPQASANSSIKYNKAETVDILNVLVECEKQGASADLIGNIANAMYTDTNEQGFYSNYKEIADFYMKNRRYIELFDKYGHNLIYRNSVSLPEGVDINDVYLGAILSEYHKSINRGSNKPQASSLDINKLARLEEFKKAGIDIVSIREATFDTDLMNIISFIDKVDITKYVKAINCLLDTESKQHGKGVFEYNISERDINFLIDLQQYFIDNTPKGKDPYTLSRLDYKIFDGKSYSQEALNKIRFYCENAHSIGNEEGYYGLLHNFLYINAEVLLTAYTLRPDKIDLIENIIFYDDNYYSYPQLDLSKEPEILNKQLELLEDVYNTFNELNISKNYYNYNWFQAKSLSDIQAKLDFWNMVKPTKSEIRQENFSNVFRKYPQNSAYRTIQALNNINSKNVNVIKELYKSKEIDIEQARDLIGCLYTEYNIELCERLIKGKRIPKDEIVDILSNITDGNKNIAELLCFDKNLNYPPKDIASFISCVNEHNAEIARFLINDKVALEDARNLLKVVYIGNNDIAKNLYLSKKYNITQLCEIISNVNSDTKDIFLALYNDNVALKRIKTLVNIYQKVSDSMKYQFNLKQKIDLFDKLSEIKPEEKKYFTQFGVDVDAISSELSSQIGTKRPVIRTTQRQQSQFVTSVLANNNPQAEKILREFNFAQYEKNGLPLKYSRAEFFNKINEILSGLSPEEQIAIKEHFGIQDGEVDFDGIFNNVQYEGTGRVKEAADKVQVEIERFTLGNEVITGDQEVDAVLTGLIRGLPEFTGIVGKEQHGTHAYSVDIHTLKVLQSAMNNPLYKTLSDSDKTVLKIAALLHDTGKRGGVVDQGHAAVSAEYTYAILDKFPFPRELKDRIVDIVANHHWFEGFCTGKLSAEDVAVRCRRPEDFAIYQILAKADFENVNEGFHIARSGVKNQEEFDMYIETKMGEIYNALERIYARSNIVLDTQFVRNGELFPKVTVEINGQPTELRVLNFNELPKNADLQMYGFSKGVTKNNARFTVHMTDPDQSHLETVRVLTENPLNQSTWSTSLIKADNNRTYWHKQFGFIFDVDQANISEAYYQNTGSGCQKGLNEFTNILFNSKHESRTFVHDNLERHLRSKGIILSDSEFTQLIKYLITKKYTTQIKDVKIGSHMIKARDLIDCLIASRDALFEGGNIHSEIVSINPRIKGMIAKVDKIEDCPPEFLQYAKDHNLPIIIMKPTDKQSD